MRTVFRAQAAEARLVLALCWAVLLLGVVAAWLPLGSVSGDEVAGHLAAAVLATAAAALFARLQLSVCRGGEALRQPWLAPVVMAFSVVPLAWGTLSPMVVLAWAPALVQRNLRQAVAATALLMVFLVWVFPRSGLAALGGYGDLFFELALYTVVFVTATRLAVLLDGLRFARELLARRRVDAERDRVGRDLHDIMGRTLVAASLRNQAALQALGDRDPAGARLLEQLHDTIGHGQAQLRALTTGPVITRLEDELAASRMLCERLQMALETDVRVPPPGGQASLVAFVVRESITNVLKHSRATRCRIVIAREAGETVVTVSHDGAALRGGTAPQTPDSRLPRAVSEAGGSVETVPRAGWSSTSVVRIPIESVVRS